MQEKSLQNARLQLKYGQSSVFEVNSLENQLLTQKISLIGYDIGYLNAVSTLYQTLGLTLDRRHIKLRY